MEHQIIKLYTYIRALHRNSERRAELDIVSTLHGSTGWSSSLTSIKLDPTELHREGDREGTNLNLCMYVRIRAVLKVRRLLGLLYNCIQEVQSGYPIDVRLIK